MNVTRDRDGCRRGKQSWTQFATAFPKEGLFAEKDWLLSPDAFPIEKKFVAELEQLGHRLFVFQRACNQLYQLSVKGKQPEWIARYLDAGKPKELIEFSRRKEIRDDLPRVIRPDLILTENGYIIAEIDSVPGGIGLTAWLNQTYSAFDNEIIGGADGMLDGFRSVLPEGGDIVDFTGSGNLSAGDGMDRGALEEIDDRETRLARRALQKITSRKTGALSIGSSNCLICRTFQNRKHACARTLKVASPSRRPSNHTSRRKCGLRFLDAAASRILATRAGRQIFHQITRSDSVLLAARSNAVAATCGHPATGNSRLARSGQVQPERSRSSFEGKRLFAARLGQPRDRARRRSSARGMGTAGSTTRSPHLNRRPRLCSAFIRVDCFEHQYWDADSSGAKNNERPCSPLSVLFCRSKIA